MRQSLPEYDVIVVGGGPAGAATATLIARAMPGASVLLFDRAESGRDKPCGEVFSPAVRGLLAELGVLEEVLASGAATIHGAIVYSASGRTFSGGYTSSAKRSPWAVAGGVSLERRILDQILWNKAASTSGVDARRPLAVRSLLRDLESGAICGVATDDGPFRARIVVGADGVTSRVARALGVVRPYPHLQKLAMVAHLGLTETQCAQEHDPYSVEMHVGTDHGVVAGAAHCGNDRWNVSFELTEQHASRLGGTRDKEALLREYAETLPALRDRVRASPIVRIATCGMHGHGVTTPVKDGALLVGDAAAFVDPFTGEGVYFALRGAQLASNAIVMALHEGDCRARGRALRAYRHAWRLEFAPKYFVCDAVQYVVNRPILFEPIARQFARRAGLADSLLAVTGDMAHPVQLLAPRFLFGLATA